jgi:dolichyl-phosphate beta-glucosyltransferase
MGKTFNKIVQLLVVKGIQDTQCGFKGFKKSVVKEVFGKAEIDGFGFDVEIMYLANKLGYKIKEISVEWFNDEQSKISPIKDSIKMLREILKIRKLHK